MAVGEWRYYQFSVGAFGPPVTALLKENVECASPDKELGTFPELSQCARACDAQPGCRHFIFGNADGPQVRGILGCRC